MADYTYGDTYRWERADGKIEVGSIERGEDGPVFVNPTVSGAAVKVDEADGRFVRRWGPFTDPVDGVLKAESEGFDDEDELFAYVRILVDTGLVNSTGSNQRFVAAVVDEFGPEVLL